MDYTPTRLTNFRLSADAHDLLVRLAERHRGNKTAVLESLIAREAKSAGLVPAGWQPPRKHPGGRPVTKNKES